MKYSNGCGVDLTTAWIDNCKITTLGLESKAEKSLIAMKRQLGVSGLASQNYAQILMQTYSKSED